MIKKIICYILVISLAASLLVMPAAAESRNPDDPGYPFVFLHGLLGWGELSGLQDIIPYWGMTSGDLVGYLNAKGIESYSATVGPLSSAWDRACELYAQLTGTTVDYGIVHSAEKGHERFGITYDEPFFEGWSAEKKINIVGHSFGGATARLFLDILADGAPEEVAAAEAAGVEPSPFFTGGKGDWVYSLTAVSAPHNGTSFIELCPVSKSLVIDAFYNIASILDITQLHGYYDLQLDHFGIEQRSDETDLEYLSRVLCSKEFLSHDDNALYDLTIDNALAINDGIELRDNVYYFSVYGVSTVENPLTGNHVPSAETFALLKPYCSIVGGNYDIYTKGGIHIDRSWLPNDGLVNAVSAMYPYNSEQKCLKQDDSCGYRLCSNTTGDFLPGVWNVMPPLPYDHVSIAGGILSNDFASIRSLYLDIIGRVTDTYQTQSTVQRQSQLQLLTALRGKIMSPIYLLRDFIPRCMRIENVLKIMLQTH